MDKKLHDISKHLKNAAKAKNPFSSAEELGNVFKIAHEFDWESFIKSIQDRLEETNRIESDFDHSLFNELHSLAKDSKTQIQKMSDYLWLAPLRITRKKSHIHVQIGKLLWKKFEASDPTECAGKIFDILDELNKPKLSPADFFQSFKTSYQRLLKDSDSRDGYVRLDWIYREFFLDRIRIQFKEKSLKSPSNIKPYDLADFIVDFAQFLRSKECSDHDQNQDLIRYRTPPMSQMKFAIFVPNLAASQSAEKPWVDVKIEKCV